MPPLTCKEARELGISRRHLYSSAYRQLYRGVFVPADEPLTVATWTNAARLILPTDAQPTGLTALQLAGVDLGQPLPLHFATATQVRCRRPDLELHRREPGKVTRAMSLAEHCSAVALVDAVTVADRAVQLEIIPFAEIFGLREHPSRRVRAAARLVRPGAESPQETRTRLCLVLAGLPEPQLQVVVRDDGRFVGRFDMGYEEYALLIEYEGDQHRVDKRQWSTDILREERARQLGRSVVRITGELFRDPWAQVLRVHRELVQRGYRGPEPSPSPAWEAAFGSVRGRRAT